MTHLTTAGLTAMFLALAGHAYAQTAEQPAETPAPAATEAAPAAGAEAAADAPAETAEAGGTALANGMDLTPDKMENGRWYNAEGVPVFKKEADGTFDYATFSGFRRYSAECHVCHGPDGEGSTYAPALKKSVLRLDYYDFLEIAASGKQEGNLVMPAFGTNKNAWCYIDDIYVYLLARGTEELPRGRPAKRADKSDEFTAQEDSCMNG
ncbi:c-type cytochrome, methanol metabolism-related [Paracoccus sulfuroxidans]|uniref:Methanol metabolism-related c-type cytochrome n=1 Tax=Paracoccus sulfuroxidans TaxID=384678 RepID=A0A562NMG6_9RHOB|nr:c-type cytochrome, methanol metabolism-related [Paracoccus sulfuroxidans]TWI33409.1 methanol metabolism-related c-type cytochrome [Paracoccus sulfuroxidans]